MSKCYASTQQKQTTYVSSPVYLRALSTWEIHAKDRSEKATAGSGGKAAVGVLFASSVIRRQAIDTS